MRRRIIAAATILLAVAPSLAAAAPGHRHPDRARRVQKGTASFYGRWHAGRTMANGKPFRTNRMTAASRTLPLGTRAKVLNRETGRTADVTITDRGPYAKGRIIDVTPRAARQLGMVEDGTAEVAVKPISLPAPPPPATPQ